MKKVLFLFLISLLTTWVPCGFAAQKKQTEVPLDYNLQTDIVTGSGAVGISAGTGEREIGGGITGYCEEGDYTKKSKGKTEKIHYTALTENQECHKRLNDMGMVSTYALCRSVKDNKVEHLSCASYECGDGEKFVLRGKSHVCVTKQFANNWCAERYNAGKLPELKKRCPDIPVAKLEANDNTNRQGKTLKGYVWKDECECANKNMVEYDCNDDGKGTPPTDDGNYTNLDKITIKSAETCNKIGHRFTGWKCNNAIMQPGDEINDVRKKLKCTAQWEKNEYNLEYKCDEGSDAIKTETKLYNDTVNVPGYNAACKKDGNKFTNWKCGGKAYEANQTFNITSDTTCVAQWESCEQCDASEGCDCELYVENNICKYKTTPQEGYYIKSGEKTKNPQCGLADAKKCTDSGGLWVNGECKCNPDVPGTYWDIQNKKCVCTDQNTEYDTTQQKCIAKCNPDVADPDGNGGCICRDGDRIYRDGVCECPPGKTENDEGQCVEPTKCPEGTGTPPGCTCSKDSEEYIEETNSCEPRCNESVATWNGTECECNETGKTYYPNDVVSQSKCECPPDKPDYEGGQCILLERCPDYAPGDNYPDGCVCKDETKTYNTNTGKCDPKCNEEIAIWNGSECVCKEGTKEYHENTTDVSLSTCECKDGEREYDDNPGKCETLRTCPPDSSGDYETGCTCDDEDMKYDPVKNKCVVDELKKKQKAYEEAKAKEQSKENRTLTALSVAATGIGGMELAMGLSQQAADADADQSMAAYLATMRCTYGNDVQVRAGPDEIELPGGNNSDLMSLRNEYFALALDLKERKEALGMKPGIESEEIIDKAQTGLYDDESLSIESGAYASLYRAQMLGSEADQAKIDEERKASKNRVIAGGVLVGAGVVGGMIGDSLINGKLGERIKAKKAERKAKTVSSIDTEKVISNMSLDEIKQLAEKYNVDLGTSDLD